MKTPTRYLLIALILAAAPAGRAVIILSQDFDTSPLNYTLPGISDPFRFQASDPTRYWGLSNMGMTLNPGITGNATTYLAAQNMNNDGDGTLAFDQTNPAQIDFAVNVTGFTDLRLSVDLAGLPNAEPENLLRAFVDSDGDTFYETQLFNFVGSGNTAYTDAVLGSLSSTFTTFADIPLPASTDPQGILRVRFEIFNDTQSLNEAEGLDNVVISGVPEPTTSVLLLTGLAAFARRRR